MTNAQEGVMGVFKEVGESIDTAEKIHGVYQTILRIPGVESVLKKINKKVGASFSGSLHDALKKIEIPEWLGKGAAAAAPLLFAIHTGIVTPDMSPKNMQGVLRTTYEQFQKDSRKAQFELRASPQFEETKNSVTHFLDTIRPFVLQMKISPSDDEVTKKAKTLAFADLFYPDNHGISRLKFVEGDEKQEGSQAWFFTQLENMIGGSLNIDILLENVQDIPTRPEKTPSLTTELNEDGTPKNLGPIREVLQHSPQYIQMKKTMFALYENQTFKDVQALSADSKHLMYYELLMDGEIAQVSAPKLYEEAKKIGLAELQTIMSQVKGKSALHA